MSELLEEKRQHLATCPMQRGHLMVFEGGKLADGCYVKPQGIWRSILGWLVRDKARPAFRKIKAGEKEGLAMKNLMSVENQGRKIIEMEEGGDA